MARVNYNVVMHSVSGKIGDLLIFRQRGGKTFISKIPVRSTAFTAEQVAINEKFKAAIQYARTALKDPAIKRFYKEKAEPGQTAHNLAVADFFGKPEVQYIDASLYTGMPGNVISIAAIDDCKVKTVRVAIINASGATVEQGNAFEDSNTGLWIYAATQTNSELPGTRIVVTAADLPGNQTTVETQV
jgi:hypothetical protein